MTSKLVPRGAPAALLLATLAVAATSAPSSAAPSLAAPVASADVGSVWLDRWGRWRPMAVGLAEVGLGAEAVRLLRLRCARAPLGRPVGRRPLPVGMSAHLG